MSVEHTHWKCLEQIIYLYFSLGNFISKSIDTNENLALVRFLTDHMISYLECLTYIRLGYDRVATYRSIYDIGHLCLILIERRQPSMKIYIDKMFASDIDESVTIAYSPSKLTELELTIDNFQRKLFKKTASSTNNEKQLVNEPLSIES
jgi:hypothetical protein